MLKFRWMTLALVCSLAVIACEKTKSATKVDDHKEGDGHDHKEEKK